VISFLVLGLVALVPGQPGNADRFPFLPETLRRIAKKVWSPCCNRESLIPVPETRSAFYPRLERLKTAGRATDLLIWFSESGFIGVYP